MKTREPILPPGIKNEPLLAGVEDNPVFRMLMRHGDARRRFGARGAERLFPFTPAVWDELEVCPIGARDYAAAFWAYQFARPRMQTLNSILRMAACLIALGVSGYFMTRIIRSPVLMPFSVYFFLGLFRLLYKNAASLYSVREPIAKLPYINDKLHIVSGWWGIPSIFWIPLYLVGAASMAWFFSFITYPRDASVELPLLGLCWILIGELQMRVTANHTRARRAELFDELVHAMDNMLEYRRDPHILSIWKGNRRER